MHLVAGIIAYGIYSAALISLGAVGFSLQFGVTNALNLAFGSVMTASVFVDYYLGRGSSNIWLGVLIGAIGGAVISWLVGAVIARAFIRRGVSLFGLAMVMIALSLVIQFSLEAIQGPIALSFRLGATGNVTFASVTLSYSQIIIIAAAAVIVLMVHLLLRYTRLGLKMRATSIDPALTRSCGVATDRVRNAAWLISGALCGVCGVFLGLSTITFDSTLSTTLFITIIAAAVIGGIGHPYGAMLGALVIGLVSESAAAVLSPVYKDVIAWTILVLVLLLRPQGIFKELAAERRLVE
jgi:branched-subunit amino acid ABC-type transport system permease component